MSETPEETDRAEAERDREPSPNPRYEGMTLADTARAIRRWGRAG